MCCLWVLLTSEAVQYGVGSFSTIRLFSHTVSGGGRDGSGGGKDGSDGSYISVENNDVDGDETGKTCTNNYGGLHIYHMRPLCLPFSCRFVLGTRTNTELKKSVRPCVLRLPYSP